MCHIWKTVVANFWLWPQGSWCCHWFLPQGCDRVGMSRGVCSCTLSWEPPTYFPQLRKRGGSESFRKIHASLVVDSFLTPCLFIIYHKVYITNFSGKEAVKTFKLLTVQPELVHSCCRHFLISRPWTCSWTGVQGSSTHSGYSLPWGAYFLQ